MSKRRRRRLKFELKLNGRAAKIGGVVFGVLLIVATIGCVVYSSTTRSTGDLPAHDAPEPLDKLDRIEGWVPHWTDEPGVAHQAVNAGFTDLMFFHGSVDADGEVRLEDTPGLREGVKVAHRFGARSWLTVTNNGGSLDGALGEGRLALHADNVLRAFSDSGCEHLDIDYEGMGYHHAAQLLELVNIIAPRLPAGAQLALTLQPVDNNLRPSQRGVYRELISHPDVYTVRLMMYDYHWRNSLPGALYPMPAFKRLVEHWSDLAHKLTLALPLYGYDWARPEDVSIPRAESLTLSDLRGLAGKPGFKSAWMRRDGELAVHYEKDGVARMVSAPSLRAVHERVAFMLEHGVPGASFWHLGCGKLAEVVNAASDQAPPNDAIPYGELDSWDAWLLPFKRRVCKTVRCEGADTLETIGDRHGISRSVMHRFNEHITGTDCQGKIVYIPANGQ